MTHDEKLPALEERPCCHKRVTRKFSWDFTTATEALGLVHIVDLDPNVTTEIVTGIGTAIDESGETRGGGLHAASLWLQLGDMILSPSRLS